MKKYCLLQLKRAARFLPWALCVVLVLFGCMSLVFRAMTAQQDAETAAQTAKFHVGVVGTAGDQYLQWGLAAMQFDTTAMSLSLKPMEEADAIAALEKGEIAAYLVFPEGFVDNAMHGNVMKLRFVSTAGAASTVSIIKQEITAVVDGILTACESGSYGVGDAIRDNGLSGAGGHINDLALEYVDFLFDRSKMYRVESLQTSSIPFDQYMLGGLTVLLLLLSCLSFAPLYVRSDHALSRVLRARRVGAWAQTLGEFAAYFVAAAVLLGAVACVFWLGGLLPEGMSGWTLLLTALPVLFMVTALTYCTYSLSQQLIGGVLITFFAALALCFIGGCMYPVYFFPLSVQKLSRFLPTAIAREHLTACFAGTEPAGGWALLAFGAAFLAISVAVRAYKVGKVRG